MCVFLFSRESNYCKLTVLGCSVIATSTRQIFVSGLGKSSLNSKSLRLSCVYCAESMQHLTVLSRKKAKTPK